MNISKSKELTIISLAKSEPHPSESQRMIVSLSDQRPEWVLVATLGFNGMKSLAVEVRNIDCLIDMLNIAKKGV